MSLVVKFNPQNLVDKVNRTERDNMKNAMKSYMKRSRELIVKETPVAKPKGKYEREGNLKKSWSKPRIFGNQHLIAGSIENNATNTPPRTPKKAGGQYYWKYVQHKTKFMDKAVAKMKDYPFYLRKERSK